MIGLHVVLPLPAVSPLPLPIESMRIGPYVSVTLSID
jgi:hypothetical protein